METSKFVVALAALAQESRLKVFRLLVQAGANGITAGKIAETVGIAPSSLSFHMKELSHARMVISRHEGRSVIYSANYSMMNDVITFLTENCCQGTSCTQQMPDCCTEGEANITSTP